MPSLALDTRLIWFAHCPKAGGTSVEALMSEKWGTRVGHLHWGWDLWWKEGGWRTAEPPNSPQHLTWADAEQILPSKPDLVFALVRDPVARIMSEYRYQRRYRRGTRAGRALAFLPFPLWLRLMLAVARRNPYAFDNHLRPQSDFVPAGAEVFRLEDGLQRAVDWLAMVAEAEDLAAPERRLATGHQDQTDPATLARISDAFAEDYRRFGYYRPRVPPARLDFSDWVATLMAPFVAALERRGRL